MTLQTEVAANARRYLRDWGTFFETGFTDALPHVLRMPHPLVAAESLVIEDVGHTSFVAPTEYEVNERHGLIKLLDPTIYNGGLNVSGAYYQWFLDEDLLFFADVIIAEHAWHTTSANYGGFSDSQATGPEVEVISIGTLVQALWSLTTEFSTDIDVSTPEGISIPAHQRFNQVYQLMQHWQAVYDQKAAMLNVGLNKMEVLNLRRISRLTNRYPPMYRSREVDDPRPPVRVYPPIDRIMPTPIEQEEIYWQEQYKDTSEVIDIGADGGWFSVGSSGRLFLMPQLGPQFEQLAMFHPAKDFVGDLTRNTGKFYPMDVEAYEPQGGRSRYGQMWHEKRAEAATPSAPGRSDSLRESIQREGVRDPIEVYHYDDENRNPFDPADRDFNQPATWNGHHRAIVTHDLHGRNALVPVVHQDQYNEDWVPPTMNPKMMQGLRKSR